MTRKAKNPNKIHANERNLPGSIVCQTAIANSPSTTSAIHILPLLAGLRSTTLTSYSNLQQLQYKIMVHRGGFEPP